MPRKNPLIVWFLISPSPSSVYRSLLCSNVPWSTSADGQDPYGSNIAGQNGLSHGHVERNTKNKLQKLIKEQETDPQFESYNSEAESGHSDIDGEPYYINDDDHPASNVNGGMWNSNGDVHGGSGKNLTQSNLQKHKSLSTPLFDLTKLDAVDVDIGEDGVQNLGRDSDTESENNGPGIVAFDIVFMAFVCPTSG